MGGGSWNVGTYDTTVKRNKAAGKSTFDYDYKARTGAVSKVHKLLDPKTVAGDTSKFAGKIMREVCISDEHPNPTPIGIVLDVTGSNITAATTTHSMLPKLFSLLQTKGYADDPQINVSATGDAYSDRYPIQFGQFESDNRIDEQLAAMILEGNGGGQVHETYEMLAYLYAYNTNLEPLEQLGKKGYLFFIGDEKPYAKVNADRMKQYAGVDMEADVDTAKVFADLQEKYEVFFLFQKQGSYSPSEILPPWKKLLGERALVLDDPATVCDTIAGIVGVLEKNVSIDDLEADLGDLGTSTSKIKSTSKAVALATAGGVVPANRPSKGADVVAKATGSIDLGLGLSGNARL